MIGKAEWFKRRKYGGWGLYPKTWQGWTYISVFVILFFAINTFTFLTEVERLIFMGLVMIILLVDVFSLMARLKQDEREKIHEAIAERNALWGMMIILIIGVGYESAVSVVRGGFYVNPFIASALIVGVLIKSISNIYLDKKN